MLIYLNKGQKILLFATLCYIVFWNTQYYWENLPGLFDMIIYFVLFILLAVLVILAFFQLLNYIKEEPRNHFRLFNIALIAFASIFTYLKPYGLYDFEKLNGDPLLRAVYSGAGGCSTSVKLYKENRFKRTSSCFGIENYWGSYKVVRDTLKLHYDDLDESMSDDFMVLKLEEDKSSHRIGILHYHFHGLNKSRIPLIIREFNKNELNFEF